jgi:hypothetical protein
LIGFFHICWWFAFDWAAATAINLVESWVQHRSDRLLSTTVNWSHRMLCPVKYLRLGPTASLALLRSTNIFLLIRKSERRLHGILPRDHVHVIQLQLLPDSLASLDNRVFGYGRPFHGIVWLLLQLITCDILLLLFNRPECSLLFGYFLGWYLQSNDLICGFWGLQHQFVMAKVLVILIRTKSRRILILFGSMFSVEARRWPSRELGIWNPMEELIIITGMRLQLNKCHFSHVLRRFNENKFLLIFGRWGRVIHQIFSWCFVSDLLIYLLLLCL